VSVVASVDTIESAIQDMRAGRPVVVTDHAEREDEGDLVVAASHASPAVIAFMMTHCRGLICAPITSDRAAALELPPMVVNNRERLRTAFTVSIDAVKDVTTGISASDRARAVALLVDPDAGPGDLVRPGHLFPLIADPGGVLARAGHTEAGVDLATLAGLAPAAVICEIAGEDGDMLRGQALRDFSRFHGFTQVAISDLAQWIRDGR